jgi:cell division septum initiation protein DivIVA
MKLKSDELKEQIAALEKELKKAKDQERKLSSGSPVAVADFMHEKMCHHNHVDGCGWDYESWDRPGSTRQSWMDKATTLLANAKQEGITPSQVVLMIKWLHP